MTHIKRCVKTNQSNTSPLANKFYISGTRVFFFYSCTSEPPPPGPLLSLLLRTRRQIPFMSSGPKLGTAVSLYWTQTAGDRGWKGAGGRTDGRTGGKKNRFRLKHGHVSELRTDALRWRESDGNKLSPLITCRNVIGDNTTHNENIDTFRSGVKRVL